MFSGALGSQKSSSLMNEYASLLGDALLRHRARVAELVAQEPHARLVDFMIPSPVTRDDANYWDPLHYRSGIATWLARNLREAANGPPRIEATGYTVR